MADYYTQIILNFFLPIKTLHMRPLHLGKWLFKASFQEGQNFSLKGGTPWRDTPLQGLNNSLSSPIYVDLVKLCLIIWNLKIFEVWLFPHSLSLTLYKFPPPLSQFLSSIQKSLTFPYPFLLYFLSATHTHHFSIPPSHSSPSSLYLSFLFIPFSLFSQSKE